jgi:hypothetical protein
LGNSCTPADDGQPSNDHSGDGLRNLDHYEIDVASRNAPFGGPDSSCSWVGWTALYNPNRNLGIAEVQNVTAFKTATNRSDHSAIRYSIPV